jgi:hypothetical protein
MSPSSSLAQDTGLSRRRRGFESRWGRQFIPTSLFTEKNLSDFESTSKYLKAFDYIGFEKELYKKVKLELVENGLVEDFSNIFPDRKETIYFDDHHMFSRGNNVIAHRMIELVLKINQN